VYYSVTIFSQIGLSSNISQLLAAVMNTIFAIGSIFLPTTIERFGRRKIMIYSACGLAICLVLFIGMIGSPHPTLAKQWTAVAAIVVYNLIFGYGWIGVCWLYGPEVSISTIFVSRNTMFTTNDPQDRPAPVSPRGGCSWRVWRMAFLFHHCVCWRNRTE